MTLDERIKALGLVLNRGDSVYINAVSSIYPDWHDVSNTEITDLIAGARSRAWE